MKQLPATTRLAIYENVLLSAEKGVYDKMFGKKITDYGLCFALHALGYSAQLLLYPEILEQCPKTLYGNYYWFKPGEWEQRSQILKNAIKKVKRY